MNLSFLRTISPIAALAMFAFASCSQQRVTLVAGEEDLVTLNGCVVSACNYLAVVKTQHSLEKNFWAKILLVRFDNHPAGHAYCVWETEGNIYGYDRNSGAFPLPVYTRDPKAIAIVLAQELGRVLQEPLAVQHADFVDPNETELYRFGALNDVRPPSHMSMAFQLSPLTSPN